MLPDIAWNPPTKVDDSASSLIHYFTRKVHNAFFPNITISNRVTEGVFALVSELFVAAFAGAGKIFKGLID